MTERGGLDEDGAISEEGSFERWELERVGLERQGVPVLEWDEGEPVDLAAVAAMR